MVRGILLVLLMLSVPVTAQFVARSALGEAGLLWVDVVAVAAMLLGVGLLGFIAQIGRRAGSQPDLLEQLVSPALYLTVGALGVLVGLYIALACAIFYHLPGGLILIIGVLNTAFLGLSTLYRVVQNAGRREYPAALGYPLSRHEEPTLWALVEAVASQVGTRPPDHLLAGFSTEFFVTEHAMHCPGRVLTGRTLYISLPSCRLLSQGEFRAIIGHEMAHFRQRDTAWGRSLAAVYQRVEKVTGRMAWYRKPLVFLACPVEQVLAFFLQAFGTAAGTVRREMEFRADRTAAVVAGVHHVASSLVKLHAWDGCWEQVIVALVRGLEPKHTGRFFASTVRLHLNAEALESLRSEAPPHPLQHHPTLNGRLTALGTSFDEALESALSLEPPDPATDLFIDHEGLERALAEYFVGRRHESEGSPRLGASC